MKRISFILLLIFVSCSKESPEVIEPEVYLELGQSFVNSDGAGRSLKIQISSNADWEITSIPEWITASPGSGEGDEELQVNVLENNDGKLRKGDIIISFADKKKNIAFNQPAPDLKLVSYTGSDSTLQLSESKYILFNKPVKINHIGSGDPRLSFSIPAGDMEFFDDRRGVRFTGGPSSLGSDLIYKYIVTDDDDKIQEGVVSFQFYSQKMDFPGEIKKIILDEENNIWVLTVHGGGNGEPGYIYKYSEKNGRFEQELKFPTGLDYSNSDFVGGDFFINPYNSLIYVPNREGEKIEVYSKSGKLVKEIIIEPGSADHSTYPHTSPYSIAFLNSGKGIVALSGKGISGIKWRFIDSSNNDIMTEPEESHPYYYTDLHSFQLNHTGSKMFLLEDRSPVIKVFTGEKDFEEINMQELYPQGADAVRISTNKLHNKIYVLGLNNQQIISDDRSYKSPQSLTSIYAGDFCYDEAVVDHIYALNGSHDVSLQLFNQSNQNIVREYPVDYLYNRGLLTTTDDNYIILHSGSRMLLLKTAMLK